VRFEFFIASRITRGRKHRSRARSLVSISIFGISLSLCVMIISVAVVTGFKKEITQKVTGFASDIQLVNLDSNRSFETAPVERDQTFVPALKSLPGVRHVQAFGIKAGFIRTGEQMQGVVLKGIGPDFDGTFFQNILKEGSLLEVNDSVTSNSIVISVKMANLLNVKTGDAVTLFFIQAPPRMRRFVVSGLYESGMGDFDNMIALADIKHIQRLNGWDAGQVSGLEIFLKDYRNLEEESSKIFDVVSTEVPLGGLLKMVTIRDRYYYIFDWLGLLDMNVIIILTLMVLVAGFNMISGLLILILERTGMIGVLKSLGAPDRMIRRIFITQAGMMTLKGLFWGNLTGIGLCLLQKQFSFIPLDQASYFISSVPINLSLWHLVIINAGTMACVLLMLVLPSAVIARIRPEKSLKFS